MANGDDSTTFTGGVSTFEGTKQVETTIDEEGDIEQEIQDVGGVSTFEGEEVVTADGGEATAEVEEAVITSLDSGGTDSATSQQQAEQEAEREQQVSTEEFRSEVDEAIRQGDITAQQGIVAESRQGPAREQILQRIQQDRARQRRRELSEADEITAFERSRRQSLPPSIDTAEEAGTIPASQLPRDLPTEDVRQAGVREQIVSRGPLDDLSRERGVFDQFTDIFTDQSPEETGALGAFQDVSEEVTEFGTELFLSGAEFGESVQERVAADPQRGVFIGDPDVEGDTIFSAETEERINELEAQAFGGAATLGTQAAGFFTAGAGGLGFQAVEAVEDPVGTGQEFVSGAGTFLDVTAGQFAEDPAGFIAEEGGEEVGEALVGAAILGPLGLAAGATPTPEPEVEPTVEPEAEPEATVEVRQGLPTQVVRTQTRTGTPGEARATVTGVDTGDTVQFAGEQPLLTGIVRQEGAPDRVFAGAVQARGVGESGSVSGRARVQAVEVGESRSIFSAGDLEENIVSFDLETETLSREPVARIEDDFILDVEAVQSEVTGEVGGQQVTGTSEQLVRRRSDIGTRATGQNEFTPGETPGEVSIQEPEGGIADFDALILQQDVAESEAGITGEFTGFTLPGEDTGVSIDAEQVVSDFTDVFGETEPEPETEREPEPEGDGDGITVEGEGEAAPTQTGSFVEAQEAAFQQTVQEIVADTGPVAPEQTGAVPTPEPVVDPLPSEETGTEGFGPEISPVTTRGIEPVSGLETGTGTGLTLEPGLDTGLEELQDTGPVLDTDVTPRSRVEPVTRTRTEPIVEPVIEPRPRQRIRPQPAQVQALRVDVQPQPRVVPPPFLPLPGVDTDTRTVQDFDLGVDEPQPVRRGRRRGPPDILSATQVELGGTEAVFPEEGRGEDFGPLFALQPVEDETDGFVSGLSAEVDVL